jgi:hypothetical protein
MHLNVTRPLVLTTKHEQTGAPITIATTDLITFHDGFAFGVEDELTAFRAAYLYRHCKDTTVRHGPSGWRVSVYTTMCSAQPSEAADTD